VNRFLIFHLHDTVGNNTRMAPAYFMDADYIPVIVRILAEGVPVREAKVDIFDDGVSIFENRASTSVHPTTGVITTQAEATEAILDTGETLAELTGNLKTDVAIDEGSVVYCNLVDAGGGKNFTVQLELERLHADEEPVEDE